MKIADLKKEYLEKINELHVGEIEKPNIGTKYFEAEFDFRKLVSRKEDVFLEGHLVISLKVDDYFSSSLKKGSDTIFQLFKEYWVKYAEAKKAKGVLFVQPKDSIKYGRIVFVDECKGEGNTTEAEFKFLNEASTTLFDIVYLYEAHISDDLKKKIKEYYEVRQLLKDVMAEEPLFVQKSENEEWPLLENRNSEFDYIGERVGLQLSSDFSKFHIVTGNSREEVVIGVNKKELLLFLEELREKTVFIKELEPPMTNYKNGLQNMLLFNRNKEVLDKEYENLCEKLGGWEEVERQFVVLNKKENTIFMDIEEKQTRQELRVYEKSTAEYCFYFISHRKESTNDVGVETTFEIVVSTTDYKKEMKKLMMDKLYPSM